MEKYRVYLLAVAEAVVEVEANDENEAIELAFQNAPAGANVTNEFDMGEWSLASDLFPGRKSEDDYEVVS